MLKALLVVGSMSLPAPTPVEINDGAREARAIHLFAMAAFAQNNCPGFDIDIERLVLGLERAGYPLAWFKREDIRARGIRILVSLGQQPTDQVCKSAWELYGPSGFMKAGIFKDF